MFSGHNIPAGCPRKTMFTYYTCKSCADGSSGLFKPTLSASYSTPKIGFHFCSPKSRMHRRTCTPNLRRMECRFGSFTKAQECCTRYKFIDDNIIIVYGTSIRRNAATQRGWNCLGPPTAKTSRLASYLHRQPWLTRVWQQRSNRGIGGKRESLPGFIDLPNRYALYLAR